MLIWLDGHRHEAGIEDGIVRAGEVQAIVQARRLEDELRMRAEQVLSAAEAEAELIVQGARRQAAEMIDEARGRIEEASLQAREGARRQAVLEWHEENARRQEERADTFKTMGDALAEVVTTAVERIVYIESRAALYQRALKSVQALARNAATLTLRVSAEDYEHAHATLAAGMASGLSEVPIDVQVDPVLAPGSCIFESETGVLDASLATQLESLRHVVDRAIRKAVAEEEAAVAHEASAAGDAGERADAATHGSGVGPPAMESRDVHAPARGRL